MKNLTGKLFVGSQVILILIKPDTNLKKKPEEKYIDVNKKAWNAKTKIHVESEFYNLNGFMDGESSLNEIELNLLNNVEAKSILHLQCHFGMDSISLSKLGAKVTGVDFSEEAIDKAREIAAESGSDTKFICSNVYDLPKNLDKQFDIVFTSYGVLGWLPDLNKWAEIVSRFLKPSGELVLVEFHPVVWMFDDNFEEIKYNYFLSKPIVEVETGSYAEKNAAIKNENITWNHSLSEVFNSLIKNGLRIVSFNEFDYSPYDCFNNTVKIGDRKYRIKHLGNIIPMIYSIKACKI